MRLVTRPDLDGLTCGVLLSECETIDAVELVHPQDVTERRVPIGPADIIANLPYHPACGMWFDNHLLTDPKAMPPTGFKGRYGKAPSAARLVYEHYLPSHPALARHQTLVTETDRLDSAQLTLEDVVSPSGYVLLGLTLDPRTGLGSLREYFDELLPAVRERSIDEVLALASVRERAARMREQDQAFRDAARARSRLDGDVVVTDFRDLDPIPVGNRFLIFTLFPEASAAVRVQWGPGPRADRRLRRPLDPEPQLAREHRRADVAPRRRRPRRAPAPACWTRRRPTRGSPRSWGRSSGMDERHVGANLPWLDYGQDFGRSAWRPEGGLAVPERRERLRRELGRLARLGRAPGAALAPRRRPRRPAPGRCRAARSGSTSASCPISTRPSRRSREAGLRGLLVLTDFLWFAPARVESGVQLGGRRELVRDPCEARAAPRARLRPDRRALRSRAGGRGLRPDERARVGDARRRARSTRAAPSRGARCGRSSPSSRPAFHERAPAAASASASRAPAGARSSTACRSTSSRSTGTRASTAWRRSPGPSRRRGPAAGRRSSASSRRAGRRCRPSGSSRSRTRAGYSGALAWSALATDTATDGAACLAALRQATGHARTARLPA